MMSGPIELHTIVYACFVGAVCVLGGIFIPDDRKVCRGICVIGAVLNFVCVALVTVKK